MVTFNSNNALVKSGNFSRILNLYNLELQKKGKVNRKKFFEAVISPVCPEYSYSSWMKFSARLHKDAEFAIATAHGNLNRTDPENALASLTENLLSSAEATRVGIAAALNVGAKTIQDLIDHPEQLTKKDRAELLFKAMKAQDSRIKATATIRQDQREQVQFEHVFGANSYVEENG